jgi:hypothetical protein
VLHFSVPDEGPLTDYMSWMPDFMQGLVNGIDNNKSKVMNAITGVASMMAQPFTSSMSVNSSPVMGNSGGSGGGSTFIIQCSGNVTKNEQDLANIIQTSIWNKLKNAGKF